MNSSLKIGLVTYRGNPHCGGQGVYIRHLSHELTELGHDVEVISGLPLPVLNKNIKLTILKNLDLYNPDDLFRTPRFDELKDPVNLIEWLDVCTMGFPEPLTFGMRLKKYLKKIKTKYDIIHDNQSLSYPILSLAKSMPVVSTIHHPMTIDRRFAIKNADSFLKKIQALRWYSFISMQKRVARKLSFIITVSFSSKRDIAKEYSILDSKFRIVPNGIDFNSFFPIENIKKEPGRIIVTNSADTALKGLSYLIAAVKQVLEKRKVKLVIIGSLKENSNIKTLIKKLSLDNYIEFTGRIDQNRFAKEYAKASIAVIPSLYEGFGLPVGEAMACKTPVICTTAGALPEVAADAAKLVPPGDKDALAKTILNLLDNPVLCKELVQKGYKRVKKEFTWKKTALKTLEVYKEAIDAYN